MKTHYFAMLDNEQIKHLGQHEGFDQANEEAPGNTLWLFDLEALELLAEEAQNAIAAAKGD